jgi:hypothetical protein
LLYLYDAAGEDFEAGDLAVGTHGLSGQDFHRFIDGVAFVVDPFAEEHFQHRGTAHSADNPARHDAAFVLGRLLPFWERLLQVGADRPIPVPVAVVVTKVDACGLEPYLTPQDTPRVEESTARAASVAEEDSAVVRQFLIGCGAGAAVSLLEERFTRVAYFGVSALGRGNDPADISPLRSRRVLGPLVWLCYQTRALTDRSPLVQSLGHALDYGLRCLHGREGEPVRLASWCLLAGVACAAFYVAWRWLGLAAALVVLMGVALLPVALRRYRARGFADLRLLVEDLASARRWYQPALAGQMGPRQRRRALGVLVGIWATFAALTFAWWPLGVAALVLLVLLLGVSYLAH